MNRNGGMAEINPNDFINAGYEEKYRIKEYYYPKSWFKVSGVYLEYTALDKPNTK